MRLEAEGFGEVYKKLVGTTLQIIRLEPHGDSAAKAKNILLESSITHCEKEATWRHEFQSLEAGVKKNNGGNLPAWVTQNRSWQKLDVALKKDTVRIKASECREVSERYLK